MSQFYCPLCKQSVSRQLYEKITGIWKERESKLADLKKKEKELQKKARDAKAAFEVEKKKLAKKHESDIKKALGAQTKSFEKQLLTERRKLDSERKQIEISFNKKLEAATKKALRDEKRKHTQELKEIRARIAERAQAALVKEKTRLQKDRKRLEKQQKLQKDRNEKLLKQYQALQSKSEDQLSGAKKKIASLEEQIRKNQTPQMLGLLEEQAFLKELREKFPTDTFEHTGKGGDIIHFVMAKGKQVGVIVYELKKVSRFSSAHVAQAYKAKISREADYGILVTNAKRAKSDFGFSLVKGVIIIHPAGALVLVSILRNNLIDISKLNLTKEERNKTIKAVLDYVQGPTFKNSIEEVINDTKDLYLRLKKEVTDHTRSWEFRLDKYRSIHANANRIESKVIKLLISESERKKLPRDEGLVPIALPEKIK